MRAFFSLLVCLLFLSATGENVASVKNAQAVEEVLSGKRTVANAAWWGFDEEDATDALQAAIRSGAKKVIVPNMGKDWKVRPIQLAGNQELFFEAGVVVTAKRGEYRGGGDSVFSAANADNLTIRGYGATIRMHKEDYIVGVVLKNLGWHRWYGQYEKAEWRCPLVIRGCSNVEVCGLTLRDSGGDGILVLGSGERTHSTNIHIKDVVCDNNYRQGISVISVNGLAVEDCVFKNTWGTPPSSGVDIEPDSAAEKVKGVVFRNCRFEDNYGDGIEIFLANQKKTSDDVSILFENCRVTSRWGSGMRVTKVAADGPGGLIEFRNCVVENTEGYGIKVQDKAAGRARVRFVNCALRNVAKDRAYRGDWTPIWLHPQEPDPVKQFGGIDFVDCVVEDNRDRPAIEASDEGQKNGLFDITGSISVQNPHGAKRNLGQNAQGVTLRVEDAKPTRPEGVVLQHVMVYYEPGRFGGWPANHGIWSWGDEILVGFSAGTYKDLGPDRHAIDREKPEEHLLARSLDGGLTWQIENPAAKGALVSAGTALHGVAPPGLEEKPWRDCPGGIDFTHPDFAMTVRMSDKDTGLSRFYYSTDRGRNWEGPFSLPLFGQKGIMARTDYLVNGPHDCMLFLTASKQNNQEGRVICVRTTNGGKTWSFVSYIGPEPTGYAIMPSTVRLSPTEMLTTIRCRDESGSWIDAYLSRDNGQSWIYLNRPAPDTGEGNPPALIRLRDGRLCLTYGYRAAPWGIYACLSSDAGRTWSDPIALREDGAGRDIGYPRSVERPDGKVVTVYYFWDRKTGPERYIAATIWDPNKTPAKPAGTMKSAVPVRRVFGPEHPGGRYKHPASITQLANGDLYLAYYTGSGEYAADTAVYGARLPKGLTEWTTPVPIADTPFRSEGNPVVWQAPDGKVWLFYVVRYGATWSTSRIQAKVSHDGAATWSDPMLVTMTEGMMVRSRPLALANGDILLPAYHETGHDTEMVGRDSCSLFFRFDAQHQTWTETNRIRSRIGNIQPAVAQITDDYLVCYCRRGGDYSDRPDGRIVRAESRDGGRTWSKGKQTEFKNPNAAVEFLRLKNGHLLLIFNDCTVDRTPLTAALSTDGDKTYPHRRNLIEGPGDYAYPYAIQTDDGKVHLIFTSDERTTIYHAVFEEADLLGRRPMEALVHRAANQPRSALRSQRAQPADPVGGLLGVQDLDGQLIRRPDGSRPLAAVPGKGPCSGIR